MPPTAVKADALIREGEGHFRHLWQLTFGGQNAEGYFSGDGTKLILQSTRGDWPCDQMYVLDLKSGATTRVSTGRGRCTCGYFYDHDRRILFASTHLDSDSCPPRPDYSKGYVWAVSPGYDLFTAKPDGSDLQRLTDHPGYDAEATLSTDGQWILFTSLREGDLDLYLMDADGGRVRRLTDEPGYDGGPFFSWDGRFIVFRASRPQGREELEDYRALLGRGLVRPRQLDIYLMNADGTGIRRVTRLAGANFAPFMHPNSRQIIFSSNLHDPSGRSFALYLVNLDGSGLERVTWAEGFASFPMFTRDGKRLVFCSGRGGASPRDLDVFVADWDDR